MLSGPCTVPESFGTKWLDYINPDTERIHPNHQQNGTETGRPSCSNPNIYNLPRDERYRSCFVADPGFALITVDEAGAELVIATEYSGQESWIEALANKWDVHSIGASNMRAEKWLAGTSGCTCVVVIGLHTRRMIEMSA